MRVRILFVSAALVAAALVGPTVLVGVAKDPSPAAVGAPTTRSPTTGAPAGRTAPTAAAAADPREAALDALIAKVPSAAQLKGLRGLTRAAQARSLAPCAQLGEESYYCLGIGFTPQVPDYDAAVAPVESEVSTGDLTLSSWVEGRLAMGRVQLQKQVAEEVANAKASLAQNDYLDKMLDGPWKEEALTPPTSGRPVSPTARKAPVSFLMMAGYNTTQSESHWCGVATMQMIEWASTGSKESQRYWAGQLGTTSAGTAITSMVPLINARTTWDNNGGLYETKSVIGWSNTQFWNANVARISKPAPTVMHPLLSTSYFPYLTISGNGHFQVGRGYSEDAGGNRFLHIFEPWNEARFYPGGRATRGPQRIPVVNMLNATNANSSFKNIGI